MIRAHVEQELATLLSHPLVESADIIRLKTSRLDGYLRVRCLLTNGDYLETASHFELVADEVMLNAYRYQWMNGSRSELRRRWDNAPHHSEVDGFPHHIHIGDTLHPSRPMMLNELLDAIRELIEQK